MLIPFDLISTSSLSIWWQTIFFYLEITIIVEKKEYNANSMERYSIPMNVILLKYQKNPLLPHLA